MAKSMKTPEHDTQIYTDSAKRALVGVLVQPKGVGWGGGRSFVQSRSSFSTLNRENKCFVTHERETSPNCCHKVETHYSLSLYPGTL